MQGLDTLCGRPGFTIHHSVEGTVEIDSYPGPLMDILPNLVSNATVHGYAGRATGVGYASAKPTALGWMELVVQDHGDGIAPANLKRLFDPFFTTRLGTGGSG